MKAISAAYRWSIFSRCVAAAAGGYAIVTLLHLAMTVVLPWDTYKSMLFVSQDRLPLLHRRHHLVLRRAHREARMAGACGGGVAAAAD